MTSGEYQVTAALTQSTIGATCLEVDAAKVRLALGGNSITGATSSPPPRGTLDIGIHLTRNADHAVVAGGGATISAFGTAGVEIDSSDAIVSDLKADYNGDGIDLRNARDNQIIKIDASNNQGDGLFLRGSSGNQLSNITANGNGVGIFIFARSNANRFFGFQANSNGEGVSIFPSGCGTTTTGPDCSPPGPQGTALIGGEASNNQSYGIFLFARTMTTVIGNTVVLNGTADLDDVAKNCAHNFWFGNTFTVATPSECIH